MCGERPPERLACVRGPLEREQRHAQAVGGGSAGGLVRRLVRQFDGSLVQGHRLARSALGESLCGQLAGGGAGLGRCLMPGEHLEGAAELHDGLVTASLGAVDQSEVVPGRGFFQLVAGRGEQPRRVLEGQRRAGAIAPVAQRDAQHVARLGVFDRQQPLIEPLGRRCQLTRGIRRSSSLEQRHAQVKPGRRVLHRITFGRISHQPVPQFVQDRILASHRVIPCGTCALLLRASATCSAATTGWASCSPGNCTLRTRHRVST